MTHKRYNEIKAALRAKRKEATASFEAASRFIEAVGIRHLIIAGDGYATGPKLKKPLKEDCSKQTWQNKL